MSGFTRKLIVLVLLGAVGAGVWWVMRPTPVVLDEAKQVRIWELEHATFELETNLGGAITSAIKKRDPAAIQKRLRSDFKAAVVKDDSLRKRATRICTEESASTEEPTPLESSEFGHYLVEQVRNFAKIDSVGLRVLSIQRDDKFLENDMRRWTLKVLLSARGFDADKSPVEFETTAVLTAVFSKDEEILQIPVIESWSSRSLVRRSLTQRLFRDATAGWRLTGLKLPDNWSLPKEKTSTLWTSAAAEDFDLDGFIDLALHSVNGRRYVLRNVDGDHFEDVTEKLGIEPTDSIQPNMVVQWFDYDNDGDPDLLLGPMLYRNENGSRFSNVREMMNKILPRDMLSVCVADYDADGWVDLYVLREDGPGQDEAVGFLNDDETGAENILVRNREGRGFVNVTEPSGTGNGLRRSFAGIWFHANDDHYPDLYVVNDFGSNALYINNGQGAFEDVADRMQVANFANSMGATIGDLNNDGLDEIYVGNMFSKMGRRIIEHVSESDYPAGIYEQIRGACAGNQLYRLTADGSQYEEYSEKAGVNAVGWAYAPAMIDFDSDGRLDLYATAGFISRSRTRPDG